MIHSRKPVVLLCASALVLTSCSSEDGPSIGGSGEPPRLEMNGDEVVADSNGTGAEVSARLFDSSGTVVVSSKDRADQLQAAALAVKLGCPMLVRLDGTDEAVDAEIDRLGAERVINVPGDDQEIAETEPVASAEAKNDVAAIAQLEPGNRSELQMPATFVTWETSRAAAATARAAGAVLHQLSVPDPRETSDSIRMVTEQDTLALGLQFGDNENFQARARLAENGELMGGGGLVFPGRRMIALYGHPYGPDLGVMGEQPPAEAAALAEEYASWYQPLTDEPVIPAFEVIATVASEFPGDDGNYSNETPMEDLVPYVDAILDAGGYAVIDLQPGQGSFLEQAKIYEELLKRPNVGLALDAEWKLNPGEQPLSRIGSATAAEINEVADWLAAIVRDNNLPQKLFILHQFNVAMFPDRENIVTGQPELAWVLHADGHGGAEQKFDTWNVLRQDLDPNFFMAWKNFIDEDSPMFTPEQTYADVNPRPWFVSYQ
ncbi:cell wall-binding repeat-containing protein [Corynebacterium sp. Marseille-P4321]|uniref:cell wall-binding repeat-containing protein n=1 Tax=Corynebacterium sp. Marseille-P4321 TaxID=2736603 RepID=UPI001588495D|nr:cell wall-binding repeat-containing protein [Corynebacterium sp. Marseille-P4321]